MTRFKREAVIELLKLEMSLIGSGRRGRSVRTFWNLFSLVRDSATCLNVKSSRTRLPCADCFLVDYVPDGHKQDEKPCHHIPLNEKGDTVETLPDGEKEKALLGWIKTTIEHLEQEEH